MVEFDKEFDISSDKDDLVDHLVSIALPLPIAKKQKTKHKREALKNEGK